MSLKGKQHFDKKYQEWLDHPMVSLTATTGKASDHIEELMVECEALRELVDSLVRKTAEQTRWVNAMLEQCGFVSN